MKNRITIFYTCLLALCGIGLVACGDSEEYDFPGDPYNRVYLKAENSYKIIQTPAFCVSNWAFEVPLKCTQRASGNIAGTIEVDNSMIAAYNEEHGTNYEEMPASALVIENATLNIEANSMVSTEMFRVTLSEDEDILRGLKSQNGYLIPLCITKTEGKNAQRSADVNSAYIIVTVTNDNVNHDADEKDIKGTLVSDQSAWSVTTNGEVYDWEGPIESLLDGDIETKCYIGIYEGDLLLDINMGKSYTFDAITLVTEDYWGDEVEGCLSDGMKIYTSNDGVSWESVGSIITEYDKRVCVFYAPLTAQYIRLVKPEDWSTSIEASIFNIYAK